MRITALALLILIASSCSSNQEPQAEEIKTYDTSTFYYDIPLAVKNETAEIQRRLSFTYAIITENGKRDSIVLDSTAVLQLSAPFMQYNLNETRFKKYYKEDRYEDGDLKKIVFTYSTNHPDLPVRSATIWLDNETQDLSNIIIKRLHSSKDTTYDEDLTWTAGRGFMVLQKISAGGKEFIKQTNVFWRDR
jgi:hypothetical protein